MKPVFKVSGNLPRQIFRARVATGLIELVALAVILLNEGLFEWKNPVAHGIFYGVVVVLIISSLYRHALRFEQAIYKWRCFKTIIPDLVLIVATLSLIAQPRLMALVCGGAIMLDGYKIFRRTGAGRWIKAKIVGTPEQAVCVSFIVMIAVGTALLMMPGSSATGVPVKWYDALFTATSAHCVTGLAVINTSMDQWSRPDLNAFSTMGNVVILALIQLGGLGIMTLSSASISVFSGRLKMASRDLADTSVARDETQISLDQMVRYIVVMTLVIETIGSAILTSRFLSEFPGDTGKAVWFGVFHGISAFCNAGFSLFSNNLLQFRTDPTINLTVMGLIVTGGLGFPVLSSLFSRRTWVNGFKAGVASLTIHAKLVLIMTSMMIVGGAALLFLFDYHGAQEGFTIGERVWASFFQSVTSRTAGFNTIDIGKTAPPAAMVYMFLMFVGAAPGGTAGGIKLTTFALIFLSVKATLRRRADIEVFNRSVHPRTLHNVVVITFISLMACFLTTMMVTWLEPGVTLVRALFESISAFGTVGLSMDVTQDLHPPAKLLITLLMYLGRVGPLTLMLALSRRTPVGVSYPQGRILVG